MVGGSDDQQTIVALQTIELIQEERSVAVVDQTVEVLEYHYTWGYLAGLVEYVSHSTFFAFVT